MQTTTAIVAWAAHDTRLLLSVLGALIAIVVLISILKIAPFLSILLGTFIAGSAAGLPLEKIAGAFSKGAGSNLDVVRWWCSAYCLFLSGANEGRISATQSLCQRNPFGSALKRLALPLPN